MEKESHSDKVNPSCEQNFNDDIPIYCIHAQDDKIPFHIEQEVIKKLKEVVDELETLENHVKGENQFLKEHNDKMLKHMYYWYQKNLKLKKANMLLQ